MNLSVYIKELLFNHNVVTLPDVGSFINAYHSAIINLKEYSFSPPQKKIVFNPSIEKDDGLLINYICLKEDISFVEAENYIKDIIKNIKEDLEKNLLVELEDFGALKKGIDDKYFFIDKTNNNFFKQFIWSSRGKT